MTVIIAQTTKSTTPNVDRKAGQALDVLFAEVISCSHRERGCGRRRQARGASRRAYPSEAGLSFVEPCEFLSSRPSALHACVEEAGRADSDTRLRQDINPVAGAS